MGFRYLSGVVSAMVTPLDETGEKLDQGGAKNLIDFLIGKGVNGLFPLGSTGESVLLETDVRKQMAELVIDHANGRVPVVIHVGGQRVKEVITLARHASAAGADGIAVIPPYYYNMDDMALEQYFSLIAETVSGIPIYLYNIPSNAKNTIKTSLFARLAEKYPHIIGMKDSSMDFANFYDLVQVAKANHVTLMGNDAQILPALAVGGTGAVSAGSTAVPEPFVHLYQAFQKGDLEEARKWQAVCAQVKKMLAKSYPIAPHKKVLELRGVIKAIQSPPLRSMNEAETEELKRNLTELGYLH